MTGVRRRGVPRPVNVPPLLAVPVAIWLLGAPVWHAMERMARFGLDPAEALTGVALPLALVAMACHRHRAGPDPSP